MTYLITYRFGCCDFRAAVTSCPTETRAREIWAAEYAGEIIRVESVDSVPPGVEAFDAGDYD